MHTPFPFDFPALDGIIRALSGRGPADTAKSPGAEAAAALIRAFRPSDVISVTLAAQAIMFNELMVVSLRDGLHGTSAATQQRGCANVLKMSRLLGRVMDRLEQCGKRSYWTDPNVQAEADAALAAWLARAETPKPRRGVRVSPRPVCAPEVPAVAPDRADAEGGIPTGDLVVKISWLDAPFEQWSVETPDDRSVGAAPAVAGKGSGERYRRAARVGEPALPRQPAGYAPARIGADAATEE